MSVQENNRNAEDLQLLQVLEKLLDIARLINEKSSNLISLYFTWSDISKETIESLLEIRNKIVKHNLNSNIASLTGTSTAIVGTLVSIVGGALAVPTAGLSLGLAVGGATAAAVGGAVSAGSAVTRKVLSKQQCEKAKNVLSETIRLTFLLEEERKSYFNLLERFKDEFDQFHNQYKLTILGKFSELKDNLLERLKNLDGEASYSLQPTAQAIDRLMAIDVENKNTVFDHLPELTKLVKEDNLLTQLLNSEMRNVAATALGNLVPGLDLGKIFPEAFGDGAIISNEVTISKLAKTLKDLLQGISSASQVGLRVLNSVFIVLGIADLVKTSIDVNNGSISNESEELLRVTEELINCRQQVIEIMVNIFQWHT